MITPAMYLVTLHAVFETIKNSKFSENMRLLVIKIFGEDNYILYFPELTSIFYAYIYNTNNN